MLRNWHHEPSLRRALAAATGIILLLAGTPAGATGETYAIDKDHTNVSFSWDHLGLSRQSGRILECEGKLDFSLTDPETASIDVVLRTVSIATGVTALDKLLKSADFFDAARHPTITFKSTAIKRTSDKTGEVVGELTIMGVAKPVKLDVTWNFTGEHPLAALNPNYKDKFVSGFSAEAHIKRSEWGLTRGLPLVSDDVRVTIETELLRK